MFYMSMHEFTDALIKLCLALLVGGIVGIEREYKNKTAGFRTLVLICIGSVIFTLFAIKFSTTDASRIIANIITGIGFLGAGVIFRETTNNKVSGMTTAATIWVTAALGMCIGLGYYILTFTATGVLMLVLLVFSRIEIYIDNRHLKQIYAITIPADSAAIQLLKTKISDLDFEIETNREYKLSDSIMSTWSLIGTPEKHEKFIAFLIDSKDVKQFNY